MNNFDIKFYKDVNTKFQEIALMFRGRLFSNLTELEKEIFNKLQEEHLVTVIKDNIYCVRENFV